MYRRLRRAKKRLCLLHPIVHGTHCGCCSGKTELLDGRMRSRVITRGKNQDFVLLVCPCARTCLSQGKTPLVIALHGTFKARYKLLHVVEASYGRRLTRQRVYGASLLADQVSILSPTLRSKRSSSPAVPSIATTSRQGNRMLLIWGLYTLTIGAIWRWTRCLGICKPLWLGAITRSSSFGQPFNSLVCCCLSEIRSSQGPPLYYLQREELVSI
jgi:hypothetical protein